MLSSALPQTFHNAILRNLSTDCVDRLGLKPVTLKEDSHIAGFDDRRRWLLFIESGSVALSLPLLDGSTIETGIFGSRYIVYATALLGPRESLHLATVRSPGHGFVCSMEHGLQEFARAGEFHDLALASLHAQLMQVSQIAACNPRHDVQQRLCRWMLHCQDESAAQYIHVTQESLAEALGVRRTTVTVAMHLLRTQGVISYSRGRIRLIARTALESRACECYQALQKIPGASAPLLDGASFRDSVIPPVPATMTAGFPRLNFLHAR